MDWTLVAKLVVAAAGIFTAWKVLFDSFLGSRSSLREEYKFAKDFLDDTAKKGLHPFTLSKGYHAIAGTTAVKRSEIEYILSLEDPYQCLRDFILSKQLFERLETKGDFKLIFKKKYSQKIARQFRKLLYLSLYWILSFAALSPLIISGFFGVKSEMMLTQVFFTLPFFGMYAWMALNAYSKFSRAEHIFSNQKQHSPRIVLDNKLIDSVG
ncbi:hypothetical protein [Paraglaciecola sp.]|uniref:hypothetical protein n=1 Tax=Paraglaciecola sp. TaxID=1920173 RepID=UPI0030F441A1